MVIKLNYVYYILQDYLFSSLSGERMVSKEAIDSALNAHAQWKIRLKDAIEQGQSEFKVDVVKKDNECQFGKWLHSLPESDRQTEDYQKIKTLHAEFHKTAGEILELAVTGQKDEAVKKLEHGGGYGRITGKLVLALNEWRSKL